MSEGYVFEPDLVEYKDKRPRILVNGFPKCGTHYLLEFFRCWRRCFDVPVGVTNMRSGGWGPEFLRAENVIDRLVMVEEGMYIGGHLAAQTEVMDWLEEEGWLVICGVRDLRDVAVSMVYHIEGENGLIFPDPYRSRFMDLPTHEDRIRAVVSGHGGFPSLRERWEQYASWLRKDWVMPLDFETAIRDPMLAARSILGYLEMRTGKSSGDRERNAKVIVDSIRPDGGVTFRKGLVGEWKKEMGPSTQEFVHRRLGDWLEALGYEVPEGYGMLA
jgi:hypothetical protein